MPTRSGHRPAHRKAGRCPLIDVLSATTALTVALGRHPKCVCGASVGADQADRPPSQRVRRACIRWCGRLVSKAITSSAVSIGHCWGFVSGSTHPGPGAIKPSGGDRATLGRGIARTHACQHWRSRPARQAPDRGTRRSDVATSVGGGGGSASHEAITSPNARSSSSGSASTTARNSCLATTSGLSMVMTDQTETGWRSSAVAEIT